MRIMSRSGPSRVTIRRWQKGAEGGGDLWPREGGPSAYFIAVTPNEWRQVRTCSAVEHALIYSLRKEKPRERRNDDAQRYRDCVVRAVVVRHDRWDFPSEDPENKSKEKRI